MNNLILKAFLNRADLYMHFVTSYAMTLTMYFIIPSPSIAVIVVFLIGLVKEITDPVFDWFDMFYNIAGIIFALLLTAVPAFM